MTTAELIRVLFGVAFVVLVAVAMGGLLVGESPPRDYQAGALLLAMLGVGAGLWALSEWIGGRNGRP